MKDLNCTNICDHKVGDIVFTRVSCPKCQGKKTYFDIYIGNDGDFEVVEGSSRLVQDILKALLEQLGTNIEDPNWGSELYAINNLGDSGLVKARVTTSVVNSLKHLYDLQTTEANQKAAVLTSEVISRIESLNLIYDVTEPRQIELLLTIIAKSVEATRITVPLGNKL